MASGRKKASLMKERRFLAFLTKSRKSPASIAKSNKQGTSLYQEGVSPSDKLRSSYLVMSK